MMSDELSALYPDAYLRWAETAKKLDIQSMVLQQYDGEKVIGYTQPDGSIRNMFDKKSPPTKMVAITFANSTVCLSESDFKESKVEDIEKVMRSELGLSNG